MRDIAKIVALTLACSGATTLVALTPRVGEEVIVVFAPWVEARSIPERVWNSGGYTTAEHTLGVRAASGSDTFFNQLRWNGAVLVLSADKISALCGYEKRT